MEETMLPINVCWIYKHVLIDGIGRPRKGLGAFNAFHCLQNAMAYVEPTATAKENTLNRSIHTLNKCFPTPIPTRRRGGVPSPK